MNIDLAAYRATESEQARIADLFELVPAFGDTALDIGACDGYLSRRLADRFKTVTSLDLAQPNIDHPNIYPVKGDATRLEFPDNNFDLVLVLCAEVLEHIPVRFLSDACQEISRVARNAVVIGVPFKQDLRCGRTTCQSCGKPNPPWGHVHRFDEERLSALFPRLTYKRATLVRSSNESTNPAAAALLDFAGNPFGTWQQEEPCINCGKAIGVPPHRSLLQRIATRTAFLLNGIQGRFTKPHGNWLHALFIKAPSTGNLSGSASNS